MQVTRPGHVPAIRPPGLRPGARVALVAPAGPLLERDDLARAEALAQALGLLPKLGANADRRYGYLAGTDDDRLADLQAALSDPAVDAIWCLRGGYGVTRLLDRVDFAPLAKRPKPVIGFSDITALLLAAYARTGLVTFHGPVARQPMGRWTREHFERVLTVPKEAGELGALPPPEGVLAPREPRVVKLTSGAAEGPLVGGNLTLLHCLVGTPWFPPLDGAILFVEDVNEKLYAVDRVLAHFRSLGVLRRVAGVAVGRFAGLERSTADGALGFHEVLEHYLAPLGVPTAYGFPIGHVEEQWTLPIGVRARLDADRGTLALLEAAVT